jgi:serine/threonine-protein kinase
MKKNYCCYELEEKLGTGGMGEVWTAKHRSLQRRAAIKLIRPEVFGNDAKRAERIFERFKQEAQITALMRSAHTVDVYDFGVSEEGTFYYVMELLDGVDLETLVERFGPVPPERTIHFLAQVCDSLAEAHENGLIHRDIKPANVFVCRYGRAVDFIKVLDFGLAKSRKPIGGEDPKQTQENVISGSPAFMAPEMVLRDQPVDGRTDLYAVGCLGYWLLTGQLVFEAETAMKMMMDHVQTPAVAPSSYSEFNVPDSLDRVILDCLQKDPRLRPENADELVERLESCDASEPWTNQRSKKWWNTHMPKETAEPEPVEAG